MGISTGTDIFLETLNERNLTGRHGHWDSSKKHPQVTLRLGWLCLVVILSYFEFIREDSDQ